jgi:hypothetical protein
VKFNEKIEVHTFYERSWNDFKRKDFIKGAFTEAEVNTLLDAICSYASEQDHPIEVINLLCKKSK